MFIIWCKQIKIKRGLIYNHRPKYNNNTKKNRNTKGFLKRKFEKKECGIVSMSDVTKLWMI